MIVETIKEELIMIHSKNFLWIGLLSAMMFAGACSEEEVDFYDRESNGVYFNYENETDFKQTINFSQFLLDPACTQTEVEIQINVLGNPEAYDRKVVIKTEPMEGYPEATVVLPENIVIEADSMRLSLPVIVKRPEATNTEYAVKLSFDTENEESMFGTDIVEKGEYTIHVIESYEKPSYWAPFGGDNYFGEWTPDKHIFLCRLKNITDLNSMNFWYSGLNQTVVQAVDSLRTYYEKNPGAELSFSLPFYAGQNYGNATRYSQPAYWEGDIEKYLGAYDSYIFSALCNGMGINTANEKETWGSLSEAQLKEHNKIVVQTAVNILNQFNQSNPFAQVTAPTGIPVFEETDYDLPRLYYWGNLPTPSALIEHFYGTYSAEKYEFMLKTAYKTKGTEPRFCLHQMFPIVLTNRTWGPTGWIDEYGYVNGTAGQEAMLEYNRIFREADTDNQYGFPENPDITE